MILELRLAREGKKGELPYDYDFEIMQSFVRGGMRSNIETGRAVGYTIH